MVRELTADEVEFCVEAAQDEAPVRGNAMASGNKRFDRRVEDEILTRLEWGDPWAWSHVTVAALWNGFTGRASLAGCSYRDAAEFCQPGGYYDDLREDALADLNRTIADCVRTLEALTV
jgi:hypothetical protein